MLSSSFPRVHPSPGPESLYQSFYLAVVPASRSSALSPSTSCGSCRHADLQMRCKERSHVSTTLRHSILTSSSSEPSTSCLLAVSTSCLLAVCLLAVFLARCRPCLCRTCDHRPSLRQSSGHLSGFPQSASGSAVMSGSRHVRGTSRRSPSSSSCYGSFYVWCMVLSSRV